MNPKTVRDVLNHKCDKYCKSYCKIKWFKVLLEKNEQLKNKWNNPEYKIKKNFNTVYKNKKEELKKNTDLSDQEKVETLDQIKKNFQNLSILEILEKYYLWLQKNTIQ